MKIFRLSIIFLLLSITLTKAEPYKPKPILFVHGIDGDSKAWDVRPDTVTINGIMLRNDTIDKDSIMPGDSMILPKCIEKLTPIVWAWYNSEKEQHPGQTPTYTPSDNSHLVEAEVARRYPNKTFLEIINFDDNFRRANDMLKEDKKCEEFSQSVKILHTFGNCKILSNRIMKHTIPV